MKAVCCECGTVLSKRKEKTCEQCGIKFASVMSKTKYCSNACKARAALDRIVAQRAENRNGAKCAVCNQPFVPKRSSQICCGQECARIRDKELAAMRTSKKPASAVCRVCKETFKPSRSTHVYCTPACADRSRSAVRTAWLKSTAGEYQKPCKRCGQLFSPGLNRQTQFCSQKCRAKTTVYTKNCTICDAQFETLLLHKKTCGNSECRRQHQRIRENENRAQMIEVSCARCSIVFQRKKRRLSASGAGHVILCENCLDNTPQGDRWKYKKEIKQILPATERVSTPCASCVYGIASSDSDTGWMCRASAIRCKPGILNALYSQKVV